MRATPKYIFTDTLIIVKILYTLVMSLLIFKNSFTYHFGRVTDPTNSHIFLFDKPTGLSYKHMCFFDRHSHPSNSPLFPEDGTTDYSKCLIDTALDIV